MICQLDLMGATKIPWQSHFFLKILAYLHIFLGTNQPKLPTKNPNEIAPKDSDTSDCADLPEFCRPDGFERLTEKVARESIYTHDGSMGLAYLPTFNIKSTKCREIYYTWILWDICIYLASTTQPELTRNSHLLVPGLLYLGNPKLNLYLPLANWGIYPSLYQFRMALHFPQIYLENFLE